MSSVFLISYVLLWCVALLEGMLLVLVYRQVGLYLLGGRGRAELGGIPEGAKAPPIDVRVGQSKRLLTWTECDRDAWLVLFTLSGCPMCDELASRLPDLGRQWGNRFKLVWLEHEMPGVDPRLPPGLEPWISATADRSAYEAFDVRAAPFAYIIRRDGLVTTRRLVNDLEDLHRILEAVASPPDGEARVLAESHSDVRPDPSARQLAKAEKEAP